MNRYDVLTIIASALLSAFAFFAANSKPQVEYITFEDPIIITADLNN